MVPTQRFLGLHEQVPTFIEKVETSTQGRVH